MVNVIGADVSAEVPPPYWPPGGARIGHGYGCCTRSSDVGGRDRGH